MTDDGAGNPRFAFIHRRAWDLILDLAPIPLAGVALWYSVLFVGCLVQDHISITGESGPISSAFVPIFSLNPIADPIPTATAAGTTLYFLLDGLLRRREKVKSLDRESFGRSLLLIVSAGIVVALLAAFWCLDAMPHPWGDDSKWFAACSIILGGAWALAASTALGLRRLGKRFEAICLLPPTACLVATLLNAIAFVPVLNVVEVVAALLPGGQLSFTTVNGQLVLVTICLTACFLPAALLAERRLYQSSQRAIGIACASLWALAAAMASWLLQSNMPGVFGLFLGREPESDLQPYVALGIAGAFVLAACARVLVFYRHRAATAPARKPVDS